MQKKPVQHALSQNPIFHSGFEYANTSLVSQIFFKDSSLQDRQITRYAISQNFVTIMQIHHFFIILKLNLVVLPTYVIYQNCLVLLPRCLLRLKLFSRNEILKKHKLEFFEMVLSHASIKSYYHQTQISKVYQSMYFLTVCTPFNVHMTCPLPITV